jgi:hypothetical protein
MQILYLLVFDSSYRSAEINPVTWGLFPVDKSARPQFSSEGLGEAAADTSKAAVSLSARGFSSLPSDQVSKL